MNGIVVFLVRRCLASATVLLGLATVVFFSIKLVPGDPVRLMTQYRMPEEQVLEVYAKLGWDQPLYIQYLNYLWNLLQGDLGISIVANARVSDLVGARLAPTVFLAVYATLLSVAIAMPLAVWAAARRDRVADYVIRIAGMVGFAMPAFWIGLLLMIVFGLKLRWLPISGYGNGFIGHLRHLFMPALTLTFFLVPLFVQSLRASMLDVMEMDFVEVARAKGLSEPRILTVHVMRNALIPLVTVVAINFGFLLGGAVLIESVFSLPGIGSLFIRAVGQRDYLVVQGLSLVFGVGVVVASLLADVTYSLVDKRVIRT